MTMLEIGVVSWPVAFSLWQQTQFQVCFDGWEDFDDVCATASALIVSRSWELAQKEVILNRMQYRG